MRNWRGLWQPEVYHGHGKTHDFFEGWYYKLVDAAGEHVHAIIPGVFLGHDAASCYCFVQVLDGVTGRSTFHRYPLADFRAAPDRLDVHIGPNRFRADGISLALEAPERRVHGSLAFTGVTPWPVRLLSPGIMGPYAFVPFMECYHGVVSLDHSLQGQLTVDGETLDFGAGRGYTEKDWGQAFPRAWIWMQSNHFPQPGTCLTASVATIPWLGSAFRGFIAGLWHRGRLYRFATYNGAAITHLSLTDTHVDWHMTARALGRLGPVYRLEIRATRATGGLLHAPYRTAMLQRIAESLTAQVSVRLIRSRGSRDEVLFEGAGLHAGLEINGELNEILDGGSTQSRERRT